MPMFISVVIFFYFHNSVHLKAVVRDSRWISTYVLMFVSTLVTDRMSVLLILVTRGLLSQQISSRISWHMQKEGNKMLFSRTLANCVQIFMDGTFLSSQRNLVSRVPCNFDRISRYSHVHFTVVSSILTPKSSTNMASIHQEGFCF